MKELGLIYSYYNNPLMFKRHLEEWDLYSPEIKKQLSICVTDDCSEIPILINLEFLKDVDLSVFRIEKKVSWNWLACRNIGVHETKTKWILVTDIDHLISKDSMEQLMEILNGLNENYVYLFARTYACNGFPIGSHTNTYLMTREMYWKIGGYNERLSGLYLGTTGEFQKRVFKKSRGLIMLDILLTLFCKEDISDAITVNLPKEANQKLLEEILKDQKIKILSFPYIKMR